MYNGFLHRHDRTANFEAVFPFGYMEQNYCVGFLKSFLRIILFMEWDVKCLLLLQFLSRYFCHLANFFTLGNSPIQVQ